MRRRLAPTSHCRARRLHSVANVLAIAQRRLAHQLAVRAHTPGSCSPNPAAPACRRCTASPCGRCRTQPTAPSRSSSKPSVADRLPARAGKRPASPSTHHAATPAQGTHTSLPCRPRAHSPISRYPPKPHAASNRFVAFTHTTPAFTCAATSSATLMFSLHTHAARPYVVLFASSTASAGVRNVIATSTGPKISSCATVDCRRHARQQRRLQEQALRRHRQSPAASTSRLPARRSRPALLMRSYCTWSTIAPMSIALSSGDPTRSVSMRARILS